jgi:ADP-heptose:LPS heptosyltransferase
VLVSRTDRIGDVVLTLPLCGLLRDALGATVVFLGRPYTRPVLEAAAAVDEVLEWDDAAAPAARRALVAGARADVVVHAFPRPAVARAALAARVPLRVGTSRRWYHWLTCNRLESVARRDSPLHEAQLNVRLARSLLPAPTGRSPSSRRSPASRPGSRSRARSRRSSPPTASPWSSTRGRRGARASGRWRRGARSSPRSPPTASACSSPGSADEGRAIAAWTAALPAHAHDLTGRLSLAELVAVLAAADGVVAASTGPLHVAAAAGTRALGLFPPVRPMHPGRWAPLGARAEVLVAPAPCDACAAGDRRAACGCMDAIPAAAVRARVEAWAADASGVRARPAGAAADG